MLLDKILNHVKTQIPTIPKSAISIALFSHVSEMLCFNRVKILTPDFSCYPNIYAITFMKSASGKDSLKRIINNISPYEELKDEECIRQYKISEFLLDNEIKEKLCNKEMIKSQINKYKTDNAPRHINPESGNGTVEGMVAMRQTLKKAQIGHCNFANSEFGKYIGNKNNASDLLLTYLMEVYDGDSKAKQIQGNKVCLPVKDVPQTMFVHSASSGIINDEKAVNELKSFIDTGLGRRSFLCFPDQKEYGKPVNISDDFEEFFKKRDEEAEKIKKEMLEIWNKIKFKLLQTPNGGRHFSYKNITITKKAFKEYLKYKYKNECRALTITNELSGEISGRHWKTIKLAGVLAALYNKDLEITEEIMHSSIKFSEGFGRHLEQFYSSLETDLLKNVYDFIKENPNSGKAKIRESGIFKDQSNTKLINDTLKELQEYCNLLNENLEIKQGLGIAKYYTITQNIEDEEIKKENIEKIKLKKIDISETQFFEDLYMENKIIQIGEINKINYLYNKDTFKEYLSKNKSKNLFFLANVNKEKGKNRASDKDVLLKNYLYFDFDVRKEREIEISDDEIKKIAVKAGETLKKEKEFKDWRYIVYTGNGFHIYYKSKETQLNKDYYATAYSVLLKKLEKILKLKADEACKNTGRIARVPMSYNNKKEKKLVEILCFNDVETNILETMIDIGKKEFERLDIIKNEIQAIREKNKDNRAFAHDELFEKIEKIPVQDEVLKDFPTWMMKNNKNFIRSADRKRATSAFLSSENENTLIICDSRWFPNISQKGVGTFMYRREFNQWTNQETFEYFKTEYNL